MGLIAERRAREAILEEQRRGLSGEEEEYEVAGGGWAEQSAAAEERKKKALERRVEEAYDAAVKGYDERMKAKLAATTEGDASAASGGKYQFVGVVNDGKTRVGRSEKNSVTWYARKKPKNSHWNVRLVHVNRDAVLRDLFVKGKVDIYGNYVNEGLDKAAFALAENEEEEGGEKAQPGMKPLVKAKYRVRERSWRYVEWALDFSYR